MKKSLFSKMVLARFFASVGLLMAFFVFVQTDLNAQISPLTPSVVPEYEEYMDYYSDLQQQYLPGTGKYDYVQGEIDRLQAHVNAINTGNMYLVAQYEHDGDANIEFSESLLEEFSVSDLGQFQNELNQLESQGDTSSLYYQKIKKVIEINSY